jgi:cytochrome o ubiquinol oxidase subunit III
MSAHTYEEESYSKTLFGFWIYLLSDFVLFGALFATYIVLRNATYGGPSASDLFHLPYTLVQTCILLLASLASGLGRIAAHTNHKRGVLLFYTLTFLLGLGFLAMGLHEWNHLVTSGANWKRSAFLSGFFTLIGTHTLHLFFALLWTVVLLPPLFKGNLTSVHTKRLSCLTLFWQFINMIWIFIFAIVYLLGVK